MGGEAVEKGLILPLSPSDDMTIRGGKKNVVKELCLCYNQTNSDNGCIVIIVIPPERIPWESHELLLSEGHWISGA